MLHAIKYLLIELGLLIPNFPRVHKKLYDDDEHFWNLNWMIKPASVGEKSRMREANAFNSNFSFLKIYYYTIEFLNPFSLTRGCLYEKNWIIFEKLRREASTCQMRLHHLE